MSIRYHTFLSRRQMIIGAIVIAVFAWVGCGPGDFASESSAKATVPRPPSVLQLPDIVMLGAAPSRPSEVQIAQCVKLVEGKRRSAWPPAMLRTLVLAGGPAEVALKAALNGPTTPQMRLRLRAALVAIEERQVGAGPLVTLHMINAPVLVVLQRLCNQVAPDSTFSKYFGPFMPQRLTIHVRRQPFWKVVARIAAESGISPFCDEFYNADGTFYFRPAGDIERGTPVSRAGSLMVALEDAVVHQRIHFAWLKPAGAVHLQINFNAYWAPDSGRIIAAGPVEINDMRDGKGRSMLPHSIGKMQASLPQAMHIPVQMDPTYGSYNTFQFAVYLNWPWHANRLISIISGDIPLRLAVNPHRYLFPLSQPENRFKDAGLRIIAGHPKSRVIDPADATVDRCMVPVQIDNMGGRTPTFVSQSFQKSLPTRSPVYAPSIGGDIGFIDKSGHNLLCKMGQEMRRPGWCYNIHIRGGIPVKMWVKVYRGSIAIREPFHFQNVPLPGGLAGVPRRRTAGFPVPISGAPAPRPAFKPRQLRIIPHRPLSAFGPGSEDMAAARNIRGPLVRLPAGRLSVQETLRQLCGDIGASVYFRNRPHGDKSNTGTGKPTTPFWQAVWAASQADRFGPWAESYQWGGTSQLVFARHNLFGPLVPKEIDGACFLAIASLSRSNFINFAGGQSALPKAMQAQLMALWAPLPGQIIEQFGSVQAQESLLDRHGKILAKTNVKSTQSFWPVSAQFVFPFPLQLAWPQKRAVALNLTGHLNVYIASQLAVKRVANLQSGHAQLHFTGIDIEFGKAARISGGWRIPVHISLPQQFYKKGKQSHWLPFAGLRLFKYFKHHFLNGAEMVFLTKGGKHILPMITHSPFTQTPLGNWSSYRCSISVAGGQPAEAQMVFFTRTLRLKIPFAFHHLPIPR